MRGLRIFIKKTKSQYTYSIDNKMYITPKRSRNVHMVLKRKYATSNPSRNIYMLLTTKRASLHNKTAICYQQQNIRRSKPKPQSTYLKTTTCTSLQSEPIPLVLTSPILKVFECNFQHTNNLFLKILWQIHDKLEDESESLRSVCHFKQCICFNQYLIKQRQIIKILHRFIQYRCFIQAFYAYAICPFSIFDNSIYTLFKRISFSR